jgi:cytochrome c peroxidase
MDLDLLLRAMRQVRRAALAAVMLSLSTGAALSDDAPLTPLAQLGKRVFFDQSLSATGTQACSSCHAPDVGFSGPNERFNRMGAYEGAVHGEFGQRKPQTAAYVGLSPILHIETNGGVATFVGGSFWDGRATGHRLKDPLAEQAQGPLLNPIEQALPDAACVVERVCSGSYASLYRQLSPGTCELPALASLRCQSGHPTNDLDPATTKAIAGGFDTLARAVDDYEESPEVSAYSSKYDAWKTGKAQLSTQELAGLAVFTGKGKCANCHVDTAPPGGGPNAKGALFTDFTYDNLGVPRNPANPWYAERRNPLGRNWIDRGLGGFLETQPKWRQYAQENMGRMKVPTIRNVDKRPSLTFVKSYMHNGYFTSLETVVSFYNTRDVKPRCPNIFTSESEAVAQGCWPEAETPQTVNRKELGNLKLTADEEQALVAFMKTLSDGFTGAAR